MMMMMAMTIEMVITKKFLKTNKCVGINNQLLKAAGADITSARNKKQKQNKKKKQKKTKKKNAQSLRCRARQMCCHMLVLIA